MLIHNKQTIAIAANLSKDLLTIQAALLVKKKGTEYI